MHFRDHRSPVVRAYSKHARGGLAMEEEIIALLGNS